MRKLFPLTCVAASLLSSVLLAAIPLSVEVAPTDPHLYYQGRFDFTDPLGPRCEWSGASVTVAFHGAAASVILNDSNTNFFQIIVDGNPTQVVNPGGGKSTLPLAVDLPEADHTVQLFRRTEANQNPTQILGFELSDGARLLDVQKPAHSIEIIGDSMSCGYGNEAGSEHEHFTPRTENSYMAYGAITARYFNARYSCIAWSGRRLASYNTMAEIYDLALPTDPKSKWDFSKESRPDVIVINLGTNDFNAAVPDPAEWTAAYEAFVKRLRAQNPDAIIYIASGSMLSDLWPPGLHVLSKMKEDAAKIVRDLHQAGDAKVTELDFTPQDQKRDGLGADYHPSIRTHKLMAEKLEFAISRDLAWKPAVAAASY